MNATEARLISKHYTTEERIRDDIDEKIKLACMDHRTSVEIPIHMTHDSSQVVQSLKTDGFLCNCTIFKLSGSQFYNYNICWMKCDDSEENKKLEMTYE